MALKYPKDQPEPQAEQPQLVLKLTPAQAAIVCGALWRESRKALKDKNTLVRKFGDGAGIARQSATSSRLHKLLHRWLTAYSRTARQDSPCDTNVAVPGSGHANTVPGRQEGSQDRTGQSGAIG